MQYDSLNNTGLGLKDVEEHGPNLAEAVAGSPSGVTGGDTRRAKRSLVRATRTARDSDQVLVCRLVGGKITYVHRRQWPAIVRLANFFEGKSISALREQHSRSGAHVIRIMAFPRWVPPDVRRAAANSLSEEEASLELGGLDQVPAQKQ
jgi:hypothetical protein